MKSKFLAIAAITVLTALTATARAETAFHGLLLFGDQTQYASHLPMFHAPRDYQVIMQVSLANAPLSNAMKLYEETKAAGQVEFTLAPKPFDLQLLVSGSITSLVADLYKGNFEKGGANLGPVVVNIDKLVYVAKLNPAAENSNSYLLFGQNGEYFAAHVIDGKPSFDTIMSVTKPIHHQFHPCRGECPPSTLPVADTELPQKTPFIPSSTDETTPATGDELGYVGNAISDVKKVIYFEKNDLQ